MVNAELKAGTTTETSGAWAPPERGSMETAWDALIGDIESCEKTRKTGRRKLLRHARHSFKGGQISG
jgi:hypothetical protein